ncbi:hypothetical protein DFJ77DRAFT_456563 [Powellomyces hirtus]|nr:hypothetical protein DFJ77DRAFT_456563 [Powellomyces hirtus]
MMGECESKKPVASDDKKQQQVQKPEQKITKPYIFAEVTHRGKACLLRLSAETTWTAIQDQICQELDLSGSKIALFCERDDAFGPSYVLRTSAGLQNLYLLYSTSEIDHKPNEILNLGLQVGDSAAVMPKAKSTTTMWTVHHEMDHPALPHEKMMQHMQISTMKDLLKELGVFEYVGFMSTRTKHFLQVTQDEDGEGEVRSTDYFHWQQRFKLVPYLGGYKIQGSEDSFMVVREGSNKIKTGHCGTVFKMQIADPVQKSFYIKTPDGRILTDRSMENSLVTVEPLTEKSKSAQWFLVPGRCA